MFSAFARRSVASTTAISKRMMSGHGDAAENLAEMVRWKRMSAVMIGVSAIFGVYNVVAHEHEHPREGLPYQHIRNKPYPWSCSDCNLFDGACWDECRGKGKKEEAHH